MPHALQARLQGFSRRWLPTGLYGAAFWLIGSFLLSWILRLVPGTAGTVFTILQYAAGMALLGVAVPLVWRLVTAHMLWSLRNKLILTYLLVGLAPVILFVTLAAISTYIAAGQFAIHLADTRIEAELDRMTTGNAVRTARVVHIIDDTPPSPQTPGDTLPAGMQDRISEIGLTERSAASGQQRVSLHTQVEAFLNGLPVPRPAADVLAHEVPLGLPAWAVALPGGNFHGVVLDGDELYLVAIRQQRLQDGRLFTMLGSLPVDPEFMRLVAEGLGRARVFTQKASAGESGLPAKPAVARRERSRFTSVSGGNEPPPLSLIDLGVRFLSTTPVTDWATGSLDSVPIEVLTRPSLLYLQLFGGSLSGVVTSVIRIGLVALCILFALLETLALVMAVRLTRTMTASVADLYNATLHIDRGDLKHRIAVSRTDQLAELGRSFNRMTGSMQRLLEEQKEKERLQSELSIAQEVQANLFPTAIRDLPTLELHGVCRPARSVSGDYYDFLVFYEEAAMAGKPRVEAGVGIALGDISGKGISAALLMATLHSAVRAYRFASEDMVHAGSPVEGLTTSSEGRAGDSGELFASPGRIMALLNRHLYRSTQPEKYATLFLAHYDAATSRLTYSNAGQLPPLVLGRDNSIRRLDCGGTVVGLIDGMEYEEGRLQMKSGDILVAYSDGVTEPENDFGDFGEERLMEVVRRYRDRPLSVISGQVMQALDAWIGADEQPDDITLVLARQV